MRHKPEYLLIAAMSAFALIGAVANLLDRAEASTPTVDPIRTIEVSPVFVVDGSEWFQSIRAHCNPVEVESQLRRRPAPATDEGRMQEAACYALAGEIDSARRSIQALPQDQRPRAASVVFAAGHPAADAGDEVAAGPLMELVVEFSPDHHMALYRAGAARFESGSYVMAQTYLRAFLVRYATDDRWTASARAMLEKIESL